MPGASQPPGNYAFMVRVTDSSTPSLTDQAQVNVSVVDVAPVVQVTLPATPPLQLDSGAHAFGTLDDRCFAFA